MILDRGMKMLRQLKYTHSYIIQYISFDMGEKALNSEIKWHLMLILEQSEAYRYCTN